MVAICAISVSVSVRLYIRKSSIAPEKFLDTAFEKVIFHSPIARLTALPDGLPEAVTLQEFCVTIILK